MFPVSTRRSHLVSILLGKSVATIYEMGTRRLGANGHTGKQTLSADRARPYASSSSGITRMIWTVNRPFS